MQLEHIMLFSKIAEEKSISRVAQASHISQPALSQQMQRLEEEVGQKLFERSNRGIELTEAGQVMQRYAAQFIHIYDNFREDMNNLSTRTGTFRVAATPVAANYALPCSLFKVNYKFPSYNFSLVGAPSSEVILKVQAGEADMGFIVDKTEAPGLFCTEAFSDKVYLVANSSYNVPETIALESLKKYPLVLLSETFSSYRLLLKYLKARGHDISQYRVLYHLDSTESVKSSVINQFGMAFLPYMAIKKEIYQKQLKVVQVQDFDLNYDVYSIYRSKEDVGNDGVYAIIKYFENTVKRSIC